MLKTLAICTALVLTTMSCASDDDSADGGGSAAPGTTGAPDGADRTAAEPAPPEIPRDFTWTGRYVVPDLDVEVPFTWHGDDGNFQMVAGGEDHPIHFTNLIYEGTLYTLTYEWPDVPRNPCSNVGSFTLDDLNEGLAEAVFVGRETHHDDQVREVNHFRSTSVWEVPPEVIPPIPGVPWIRIPLMSGDIYTDADDPTTFWKVLHFGVQNLYDVQLDEWMVIDEVEPVPGEVNLPDECADAPPPAPDDEA